MTAGPDLPPDDVLKRLYGKQGWTPKQLGELYGMSSESVRERLEQAGITPAGTLARADDGSFQPAVTTAEVIRAETATQVRPLLWSSASESSPAQFFFRITCPECGSHIEQNVAFAGFSHPDPGHGAGWVPPAQRRPAIPG